MRKYRAYIINENKTVDVIAIDYDRQCVYYRVNKIRRHCKDFSEIILLEGTEFQDAAKTDIYTGDIVKFKIVDVEDEAVGVVYKSDSSKRYFISDAKNNIFAESSELYWLANKLHVIGNVYENPELMRTYNGK